MIHEVVEARHQGDYKIELVFDNGRKGVVDFSSRLMRGGVFSRLRNMDFFRTFKVNSELGTIVWGDEIDVAPETLYHEATGEPLPSWMTPSDTRHT